MHVRSGYVRCFACGCGPRSRILVLMVFGFLVSLGHPQDIQRTLSVTINESGQVSSEESLFGTPSFECSDECSVTFVDGDQIALTATPNSGFRFAEWGGACRGTDDMCTVLMTQDQSVTATFSKAPPGSPPLLIVRLDDNLIYPDGPTVVTSNDGKISCPNDCSEVYEPGTTVILTAKHPHPKIEFAFWDGACLEDTDTNVCTLIITSEETQFVTAFFDIAGGAVNLDLQVDGGGRVTSSHESLSCRDNCSCSGSCRWVFVGLNGDPQGSDNVTLVPISENGWEFDGFYGNRDCADRVVTMVDEKQCVAIFREQPRANPIPDIKVNGLDGPLALPSQAALVATVTLDAGGRAGEEADWWLAAETPSGWWYFSALPGTCGCWVQGLPGVTYQGPLENLSVLPILNVAGLPPGTYTFYFGVDLIRNGIFDLAAHVLDTVTVTVQ